MNILIVLFTILLILDCLLLGLLILVQLPKKEAGVGMAFGSGATDALFGAGSGTALSNLTTYTATAFFILVFALAILNTHANHPTGSDFKRQLEKQSAATLPPPTAPAPSTATPAAGNTAPIPLTISTSAPAAAAPATTPLTNAPAAPAK